MESFEEFETWWHSEFPEEAAWFHFAAGEDQEIGYRAIFLGHRHVLEVDGRRERSFPNDISKFTAWLESGTGRRSDGGDRSYQGLVERELHLASNRNHPARDLWRVFPQWKEEFFQDFSQQEMEEFLTSAWVSFGKKQAASIHDRKRLLSLLCPGLSAMGYTGTEKSEKSSTPPRRWADEGLSSWTEIPLKPLLGG